MIINKKYVNNEVRRLYLDNPLMSGLFDVCMMKGKTHSIVILPVLFA